MTVVPFKPISDLDQQFIDLERQAAEIEAQRSLIAKLKINRGNDGTKFKHSDQTRSQT
jgi:hypothetical protein